MDKWTVRNPCNRILLNNKEGRSKEGVIDILKNKDES